MVAKHKGPGQGQRHITLLGMVGIYVVVFLHLSHIILSTANKTRIHPILITPRTQGHVIALAQFHASAPSHPGVSPAPVPGIGDTVAQGEGGLARVLLVGVDLGVSARRAGQEGDVHVVVRWGVGFCSAAYHLGLRRVDDGLCHGAGGGLNGWLRCRSAAELS